MASLLLTLVFKIDPKFRRLWSLVAPQHYLMGFRCLLHFILLLRAFLLRAKAWASLKPLFEFNLPFIELSTLPPHPCVCAWLKIKKKSKKSQELKGIRPKEDYLELLGEMFWNPMRGVGLIYFLLRPFSLLGSEATFFDNFFYGWAFVDIVTLETFFESKVYLASNRKPYVNVSKHIRYF